MVVDHKLVSEVPDVCIVDGIVRITGDGWGLCGSPALFTAFVGEGMRAIQRWHEERTPPLLFPDR